MQSQRVRSSRCRLSFVSSDISEQLSQHQIQGDEQRRRIEGKEVPGIPAKKGMTAEELKRYGFIYFTTAEGKAAALAKATTEVAGSVARLSEPKSAPFGGKPARKPSRKV